MSRQNDIRKLITEHERRLQKRKEQKARLGTSADPSIDLEIEDLQSNIEKLQTELAEIKDQGELPSPANWPSVLSRKYILLAVVGLGLLFGLFYLVLLGLGWNRPSPVVDTTPINYLGHVIDVHTEAPIRGAKVTFESSGAPLIIYTDSEGIYQFTVDARGIISGRIIVEAPGYQSYRRFIELSANKLGLEDIRLTPLTTPTSPPIPVVPTHTPTTIPNSPKVQVVRVQYPGGGFSHGFFTRNGYLVALMAIDATEVTVTWRSEGQEWQKQARVIKRGGFVPDQVALLQVTEMSVPQPALGIRLSQSLQPGDKLERYISATDSTPATVLEVNVDKEIWTTDLSGATVEITIRNALITTGLTGPGDAGAPVIDPEGRVVGMAYGGSRSESISIPIENLRVSFPEAF